MKHYSVLSILAGISLFACTSIAYAQSVDVPRTISYQGAVTSTDGTPLFDGEHSITVTLYSDPAGTIPLWQDTYNATTSKGIFNLYLGSNKPLPSSTQMNRPLWVGTTINGGEEMRPLTPLTASPYALNLPDHAVTTDKLADGAVTAEKVEMDYVKGLRVNGQEVSGKGTVLDIRGGEGIALSYDETTNVLNVGRQSQGTIVDPEKGVSVLTPSGTATDEVWSKTGDVWDISASESHEATNNDWIGTSGNYDFTIQVNSQRVMQYRPTATSTNILGGHSSNSIGTGVSAGNIIAGGGSNAFPNTIASTLYGTISGGAGNTINNGADSTTISGGVHNSIGANADGATISGGDNNTALAIDATIGGGDRNTITALGIDATIAGGDSNTAANDDAVVGGGDRNVAAGVNAVIGGGELNAVMGNYSTISGGRQNSELGFYNFIGGGWQNFIDTLSDYSVLGGGDNNIIDQQSDWGVVGGGRSNYIGTGTEKAVIGGGQNNRLLSGANGSVIGGGESNTIDVNSAHSLIGGGSQNFVTGFDNVLSGGLQNIVRANLATISGGMSNTVDGYNSQINGGRENTITAGGHTGIIVGGHMNRVEALESFVGGGRENKILTDAKKSTIGGGEANEIQPDASYSAVGGGFKNIIDAAALTDPSFLSATIPGGDNLIAQSWAQTVIGGWNLPKGDVSSRYVTGSRKSPLFIIGNGFADPNRSNAFEVSYNGHSTVYHQNGTGVPPMGQAAIRGTTYTDNVVYAWATATPAPGHVDIGCDFGVQNIAYLGLGHYRITMNLEKPEDNGTFTPMNLSCGSVTATIVVPLEEPTCASINTTAINGNTFDIYISRNVLVISPQGVPSLQCQHMDLPFTFKVTGRPI